MWKVNIKQEYKYSYMDGETSIGTHESIFLFKDFNWAMNFIESAIEQGAEKTSAEIEFVKGEENGES